MPQKGQIKKLPEEPTQVNALGKHPFIRMQHKNLLKPKNLLQKGKKLIKKGIEKLKPKPKVNIEPELHQKIYNKLYELGIHDKSYYVGGMVRDSLLNKPANDIDIVVEKPTKNIIEKLDKKLEKTGKDFPVYRMNVNHKGEKVEVEIALARTEKKTGKGHKSFEVQTGENVSIKDDLKRRDITINAMAVSIRKPHKIIDPYGGRKDLKEGIIRHVSEAFTEDPLRVFRVARFAARFGFKVAPETLKLMKKLKNELPHLSAERIEKETSKMFLTSETPSIYFNVLRKAEVLDTWFPEIHKMIGIPQSPKYHPEGDVYNHTMETIDNIKKLGGTKEEFWGALFHDIGKIDTPKDILPKHIKHEERGKKYVDSLVKRYRLSRDTKKVIDNGIAFHMYLPKINEGKPGKILKKIEPLIKSNTIDSVVKISLADRLNRGGIPGESLKRIAIAREVLKLKLPNDIVEKVKSKKNSADKQNIILEWRAREFKKRLKD